MRLIDVDALINEHCEGCSEDIQQACQTDPVCATLMYFAEAPTIDAVEVVRCKDCNALYREDERYAQHCCLTGTQVDDMDFCSYGERRDEDGNQENL